MSAPAETNKTTSPGVPESPTTARPLDLDDDDVQETGIITSDDNPSETMRPASGQEATATMATTATEAAPPKPARPLTDAQKNEMMLKEAFPSIERTVIKAVLSASRGQIEPAFQALLEMTDPDAAKETDEDQPPPQPPRPAPGTAGLSQMEQDEMLARRLAEEYANAGAAYEQRTSNQGYEAPRRAQTGAPRRQQQQQHGDDEGREHSFLDDDLPVIRDNMRKGFLEAQTRFNSWITTAKKKLDDALDEDVRADGTNQSGSGSGLAYGQRPPGEASRRSGDYDRYDADPQVITDDFAGMRLGPDGAPVRDNRPMANPNLYKPPPPSKSPRPGDGSRKVTFTEVPDGDLYQTSPKMGAKDAGTSASKPSKWQPLSTVDPSPIADHDPFSLGDSEDEKDATKDKAGNTSAGAGGNNEIKMEDSERLRQATTEAMADSLVDPKSEGDASKKS